MNAVQHVPGHDALKMTFALMVAVVALTLAGLTGYLVKGSTTLITRTSVSAPAPAQDATPILPYGEHFSGVATQIAPYGEHFSAP